MPSQLDFFPPGELSIKPVDGLTEPLLWVRRVVLWTDEDEIVRDISFRPGLNVIWSPDGGGVAEKVGHGGGKTTLSRLIRYCLGEKGYGPDEQRDQIANRFPRAQVGAEVRLNNRTWIVKRSLGAIAVDSAVLGEDVLAASPSGNAGMQPFLDEALALFMGSASDLIPGRIPAKERWLALLAWLTRDQECRFSNALSWRHPESGSNSPMSGRNRGQDDNLAVLRLALGALNPDEIAAARQRDDAKERQSIKAAQLKKANWRTEHLKRELARKMGLEQDRVTGLELADLENRAKLQLERVISKGGTGAAERVRGAQLRLEEAALSQGRATSLLGSIDETIELNRMIAQVAEEQLPELSAKNRKAARPICPVCLVPIDVARAKGCGISLGDCDVEASQARYDDTVRRLEKANDDVARLTRAKSQASIDLAIANQNLNRAKDELSRLEREALQRSRELRVAERADDLVVDLKGAITEAEQLESDVEKISEEIRGLDLKIEEYANGASSAITLLSDRFSVIFSNLVRTEGRSSVRLERDGVRIRAAAVGSAMTSLSVALLDVSAMTLALEGRTKHPSFLLHDSPREADLGRSIYAAIFGFVRSLEEVGPAPLFQYIITTTTEPPKEFQEGPWLRLTLQGAPEEERLFKANL